MDDDRLRGIRAHEMYRLLLSTSVLYKNKTESLLKAEPGSEYYLKLTQDMQMISETFAEICGLRIDRNGLV